MKTTKIKSITKRGTKQTYDILNMAQDKYKNEGNFILDGVIVHNSIPDVIKNRDDKSGKWREELRSLSEDMYKILEDTHGKIVYQEQLANIWQLVGGFTATEAQEARKAVAKKWVEKLKPIKQKWMIGASAKLGKEKATEWWDDMESFGRYAFNKCLSKDTLLTCQKTHITKSVEEWYKSSTLPSLLSYDDEMVIDDCVCIHDTGIQEVFKVIFDNGQSEAITIGHKFLCVDGNYHELREIIDEGLEIIEIMPE